MPNAADEYIPYKSLSVFSFSCSFVPVLVLCAQEANKLFDNVNTHLNDATPEWRAKFIEVLLECNFVELVKEKWKYYLYQDLLQEDGPLPLWLHTSLKVIVYMYFRAHTKQYQSLYRALI